MSFEVLAMSLNDNLANGNKCDVFAKLRINGKEDVDAAEGVGPYDAIFIVMNKILSRHYDIKGKIRFTDCGVHFINVEEKGTEASCIAKVVFLCGNEKKEFLGESVNLNKAGSLAIAKGFESCIKTLTSNVINPE